MPRRQRQLEAGRVDNVDLRAPALLEPGEAERIRSLSQLAIQTAQATTNREALMAHMRALWPEGI